jgi:hypothetical protein
MTVQDGDLAGEEIRLSDPRPAQPTTPTQVLEELQAQLAERNLPAAEVEELIENPEVYLMRRTGDAYAAQQIVQAVASLYFKTLHLKATEGEAFTKARLERAMVEAQTRTLEAIANAVQSCPDLNLILRTAEMLTKD